ncbi:MAG: hypothetical protein H6613_17760 [Ignavibacteriales bacterium]|nr:hypothetical protein [Ignavibacteriales bacterium]
MNSLPLSWTINNKSEYTNSVKKKNICWISHANLQENNFFRTIDLQIINNPESDIIIRGCDSNIKNILEEKGFHSIKMGAEAVLETSENCFDKNL